MERNKMEEEFKEKLNQREIAPTPHAWDRLDAMLNDAEQKKAAPVRNINWLYIAAGFAGIILIATMFFKRGEATHQNEVVIEQVKDHNDNPAANTVESENPAVEPEIQNNDLQVAEAGAQKRQSSTAQSQVQHNKGQMQTASGQIPDRRVEVAEASVKNPTEDKITGPDQRSNSMERGVNPVYNPERGSDEQIASLEPQLKQPKTIKVDAKSLLSQVDGELELSFREKVIKLANKKYQNVKVALANRNIEN